MDHQTGLLGDRRTLTADEYQRLVTDAHVARSRAIAAFCVALFMGAVQLGRRVFQNRKRRRPASTSSPYVAPY